jgi:hypothetical protein
MAETILLISHEGVLDALDWQGASLWKHSVHGGNPALLSAADLDGDSRAEIVAVTPDSRMRVFRFNGDGKADELAEFDHAITHPSCHPLIHDFDRSGKLCLLAASADSRANVVVQALLTDGTILWESPLDVPSADVSRVVFNSGNFLGPMHIGIAVSLIDRRNVREGTYMLDGATGKVLWFKDRYRDGYTIFPYRPNGTPTAYDFDGDGAEDVGMDMMSYMAYLNGKDGEIIYIHPTRNIRQNGALYAGHLYNTFCPIYRSANDDRPHWFVTAGFGPFGMMKPDPREGYWREDLDYDVPSNIALVDVDGDQSLEAGYAAMNDNTFVCRDVWSGKVEWTLRLPHAPNGVTLTADFDGDGKGEFLTGPFCVGLDAQGKGSLRWQLPRSIASPLIADFDGDGRGDIAGSAASKVFVFKALGD